MTTEPFSDSLQVSLNEETARKRRELYQQYPLGYAPYTERALHRFGFWGGFIAAGVAGMVNLRRANQSRAIPALLLLTLAVTVGYWLIIAILADQNLLPDSTGTTSSPPILLGVNIAIGVGFAHWIAGRQQNIAYGWQQLAGTPNWNDQGGTFRAFGWFIISVVIAVVIYLTLFPVLLEGVIRVAHPAQHYAVNGVGVTAPAGWTNLDPDEVSASCDSFGLTCIAVVADRMTGSHATVWLVSGEAPLDVTNTVAASARTQPEARTVEDPKRYTFTSVGERDASAFSAYYSNGNRAIFTAVADGGNAIFLRLLCAPDLLSMCETVRDNFISTLEYAHAADKADTSDFSS